MYPGLMDLFISSSVSVSSSSDGPDWIGAFAPSAFGKRTEPKPALAEREWFCLIIWRHSSHSEFHIKIQWYCSVDFLIVSLLIIVAFMRELETALTINNWNIFILSFFNQPECHRKYILKTQMKVSNNSIYSNYIHTLYTKYISSSSSSQINLWEIWKEYFNIKIFLI